MIRSSFERTSAAFSIAAACSREILEMSARPLCPFGLRTNYNRASWWHSYHRAPRWNSKPNPTQSS